MPKCFFHRAGVLHRPLQWSWGKKLKICVTCHLFPYYKHWYSSCLNTSQPYVRLNFTPLNPLIPPHGHSHFCPYWHSKKEHFLKLSWSGLFVFCPNGGKQPPSSINTRFHLHHTVNPFSPFLSFSPFISILSFLYLSLVYSVRI